MIQFHGRDEGSLQIWGSYGKGFAFQPEQEIIQNRQGILAAYYPADGIEMLQQFGTWNDKFHMIVLN